LTHTLQLPPAHAEIYGGPHAEWLRDCLEYLPRLQCLLVDGLPFFDHSSLLCLRHASLRRRSSNPLAFPVFGLRLLDASGCTNTTSTGLAEALCHFPNLVSLDFSQTPAAKDRVVLSKLSLLGSLRLLSLKGLGLKDVDFAIVALSIGTRVRCLDVRDNYLTDASAQALLDHCLKEQAIETHVAQGPLPPVEHERLSGNLETFASENVAGHVRQKLTEGFVGSLAIEMARDVGVTHLYLSKNPMTVKGISGLLRSRRLQVLDVGILPAVQERPYSSVSGSAAEDTKLTGISQLTRDLSKYATKLKYLRINYEIITEDAPLYASGFSRAELDGDLGRYAPPNAHELEAAESPTLELDTTNTEVSESPGDFLWPTELPGSLPTTSDQHQNTQHSKITFSSPRTSAHPPKIELTIELQEVKRGAAYAPEPVLVDSPYTPISPFQERHNHEVPLGHNPQDALNLLSPTSQSGEPVAKMSALQSTITRSRHNSTHYVEDRRARLELRQSQENCLHPGMLSQVHTLVLTGVPSSTTNGKIIRRLIQYIKDAAEEASIARQRAKHSYALPPGRSRVIAEREHASSLFALSRIVLEMAPTEAAPKKVSTGWRAYPTKSSTEDADSEAFWEAATHDFSFFGEEECGLPDTEPGRTLPLAAMSGLELAPERSVAPSKPMIDDDGVAPLLDVIGEIAKFRKERKAMHNNLLQMGSLDSEVEGYWHGDVTVIRNAMNQDAGELDCYGNRYEAGWYYR
jgi:hypothetical protein